MTLYELTADMMELQAMLEEDMDDEVLQDTLEGVQGAYEMKMGGYAAVIKNLEAEAEAFKKEEQRMKEKRQAIENNVARMKRHMHNSMAAAGLRRVDTDLFRISIQKNGGKAPYIPTFTDAEDLPEELLKHEPDLQKLRAEAEAGNTRFGYIGERGESLRIR